MATQVAVAIEQPLLPAGLCGRGRRGRADDDHQSCSEYVFAETILGWVRQFWATLEPYTQGFYTNDHDPETTAEAFNANYRENYARLVEIKNKYDPSNLFRLNANVQPTR